VLAHKIASIPAIDRLVCG